MSRKREIRFRSKGPKGREGRVPEIQGKLIRRQDIASGAGNTSIELTLLMSPLGGCALFGKGGKGLPPRKKEHEQRKSAERGFLREISKM